MMNLQNRGAEDLAKTRLNFCICLIGTNGTGKTSLLLPMINHAISLGRSVRVFNPTDEKKFNFLEVSKTFKKGSTQLDTSMLKSKQSFGVYFDEFCVDVYERARKCFIVIDDATTCLKYGMNETVVNLMIRRRQSNQDWAYCFHSGNKVPTSICDYFTHYAIFRTVAKSNIALSKLPEEVIETILRVNAISKETNNPYYFEIIKV